MKKACVLVLLAAGCATGLSPEARRNLEESHERSKRNLSERVNAVCEKYASSNSPAQDIGYAVVSECSTEIGYFIETFADVTFAKSSQSQNMKLMILEKKPEWRRTLEQNVYRDAVAIIVRIRADNNK